MVRHELDLDISHYDHFFANAWARRMLAKVKGTSLHDPMLVLCISWKAQSAAHTLPKVFIDAMEKVFDESLNTPSDFGRKLIRAIRDQLVSRLNISNMKKKELAAITNEISDTYDKCEPTPFDREATWQGLLGAGDFRLSIHAIERNCFCTLYHDYESFFRDVLAVLNGGKRIRIYNLETLISKTDEFLGKEIAESCLTDDTIQIPRLVRNSFGHTGGRETDELKSVAHGFPVHDDKLIVLAHHTVQLYKDLAAAVEKITDAALAKLTARSQ